MPTVIKGKLKLKGSSDSKKRKRVEEPPSAVTTMKPEPTPDSDDHLTKAQRKHKEKLLEMEKKQIKSQIAKTYRDRVDELNAKLSTMTEHNDIPRISAAGNG